MTITIITCTYHAETVLQRTLDSVARQTYPNVEHLIIDGCSADGTLAMAEAYRQQPATAHSRRTRSRDFSQSRVSRPQKLLQRTE